MTVFAGYNLLDSQGAVVKEWRGAPGTIFDPPNPLVLPNGDHICAPVVDTNYNGYTLVRYEVELPVVIPYSVTPRQVRLLLLQQGLLSEVEAMIAQQDDATKITWQYASEFRRDDPLLNQLAQNLTPPLTPEQIDQFFIAAAQI